MYENIMALREKSGHTPDLDGILALLSGSMADTLLEGTAIEIMDGDAVSVPVEWFKAVLINVQNNYTSTLFKVSVLGAQSCGKSTLLNTILGLNLHVSSRRCSQGALNCDYVAVVDSEGLMSRSKINDLDYDNELSTFIIGLSDISHH